MSVSGEMTDFFRRRNITVEDIEYIFRAYLHCTSSGILELVRKKPDGILVSIGKCEAEDKVIASHRPDPGSDMGGGKASSGSVPKKKGRRGYKSKGNG